VSERPNRILIVRLSAIGDVVLSVPTLCALRRAFPDSRIGWVVESVGAQLLQGHEDLNDLFTTNKQAFRKPSEFFKLARVLRDWSPDVTIDLQGLAKSSLLAYFTGAKKRLGFAKGDYDGRELSCWVNNTIVSPKKSHLMLRGLELLKPLGIESETIEFKLPEHDSDRQFARETIHKLFGNSPYAVINVGGRYASRIWPMDRYAAVANHLANHWGLNPLVLWNGTEEKTMAEELQRLCKAKVELAPTSTLTQLRSLIRGASLYVGSDTGPTHLSVAVETPTVGLIGPMPRERTGPLGQFHRAVQRDRLPPELKSERRTNTGPILSITVDDVIQACDSILLQLRRT
jgi:heptosyltransferase I